MMPLFFFLIWGSKTKPAVRGAFEYLCKNCGHKTVHAITSVKRYFTFFFIPIFAVSHKLFMNCNACGYTLEFKDEAREKMLEKLDKIDEKKEKNEK